jgi:hypothetical protein
MTAAVLTLLLANLWRWWPVSQTVPAHPAIATLDPATQTGTGSIAWTWLLSSGSSTPAVLQRDLFHYRPLAPESTQERPFVPASPPEPAPPVVPMPQTASIRAMEQFRLVGTALQSRHHIGFVTFDDEIHTVRRGDWIDGRYRVDELDADSLRLTDQGTGTSMMIYLSEEE